MLMYSLRRTSSKNFRKQMRSIISKRNSTVTSINQSAVLSAEIHLLGMSWMWQGIAHSTPSGSPSPRRSRWILEVRVHPWWFWLSTVTTHLVPLQFWWALWPSYPQCLITERILTSSHSTHTPTDSSRLLPCGFDSRNWCRPLQNFKAPHNKQTKKLCKPLNPTNYIWDF